MNIDHMKTTIRTFDEFERDRLANKEDTEPFTKERLLEQLWTVFYESLEVDGYEKGKVPEDVAKPLFKTMLQEAVEDIKVGYLAKSFELKTGGDFDED